MSAPRRIVQSDNAESIPLRFSDHWMRSFDRGDAHSMKRSPTMCWSQKK